MSKLYRWLICGALVAWGVAGCSKDPVWNAGNDQGEIRLQVAPSIGNMQTKVSQNTAGYQFDAGDAIGLFATKSGNVPSISDKTFNDRFDYDGVNWSSPEPVYWPSGGVGTPCCLLAYYPYQEGVTAVNAIPFAVSIDQSTTQQMMANDFLVSRTLADKIDMPITIQMSHLLSMVTVNVAYQSDHINDVACDLKVQSPTSIQVDLSQWPAVVTTSGAAQTIRPLPLTTPSQGYDRSWSVIVPPQQVGSSTSFLSIVYGNNVFPLAVDKTLESGCHYSINVKVGIDGELTLEGIYVSKWDEAITLNNGSKTDLKVYNTGDVIVYQQATVPNPVVLVVTGDGFIQEHMLEGGYFEQVAREGLDFMFDVEPYKTYRDYFTVYIIPAVSHDEGVSDDNLNENKDTYFGISVKNSFSYAVAFKGQRYLTNFVQSYCPDVKNGRVPREEVCTAILANDDHGGGVTFSSPSGEGYVFCPLTPGEWVSDIDNIREQIGEDIGVSVQRWPNVFLHEFGGHCIGRLGDEYWYDNDNVYDFSYISRHTWRVPMCKNITADITPSSTTLFWKHMIGDARFPKVGVYEGGNAQYGKGIWRSEKVSCMIDDRRYFNAYSRQLIVERIRTLARETFDYDEFLAKDVNYDEILDQTKAGKYSNDYSKYSRRDLPVYPLRRPPIEIEE